MHQPHTKATPLARSVWSCRHSTANETAAARRPLSYTDFVNVNLHEYRLKSACNSQNHYGHYGSYTTTASVSGTHVDSVLVSLLDCQEVNLMRIDYM